MNLIKEKREDIFIIRLQDERLDTRIAPDLKTEFLKACESSESKIMVDLEKVSYIDSSGLGALLFGLRQFREQGGDLKLIHVASRVQKLLKIAHLNDHLLCYENEAELFRDFKA